MKSPLYRSLAGILAALPLALCAAAAQQDGDFAADLALSEKLGQTLYERDTAAYLAADALRNNYEGPSLDWVSGWLTLKEGSEYKVLFIGEDDTGPKANFMAYVYGDKVIDYFSPPGGMPLAPQERSAWRARQDALQQDFMKCAERYNPVVLPYSGDDGERAGLFVYLMPASHDRTVIKAGGYQLFDYSADGKEIKGRMPFTQNCLDVDKADGQEGDLILLHSLTPYPQEHHVFLSLLYGEDVYVVTEENRIVWKVSGGHIEFFRQD